MFKKCANPIARQVQCRFSSKEAASSPRTTKLGVLGVPFSKGQHKNGAEQAPDLLRKSGVIELLKNIAPAHIAIKDYGNLEYKQESANVDNMKNYGDFMGCNKALIKKIPEILEENNQFLVIGGDHSIAFGSVAGHLQHTPNLSLVWVDAHADINLPATTRSGNIHGMPVSLLLQDLRSFWKDVQLDKIAPNCLATDQLVYIGLRDVDPMEAYILKKLGVRAYAMDAVDKYGIAKIMEMTLDGLNPKNKMHLSFDIDALDSTIAPSTGTVVNGGLTLREGISIVETLLVTNRVQGIDLVEINPLLGNQEDVKTTITSATEILKAMCAYKRYGDYTYVNKDKLNIENFKK